MYTKDQFLELINKFSEQFNIHCYAVKNKHELEQGYCEIINKLFEIQFKEIDFEFRPKSVHFIVVLQDSNILMVGDAFIDKCISSEKLVISIFNKHRKRLFANVLTIDQLVGKLTK